jgi:hypothetical protein
MYLGGIFIHTLCFRFGFFLLLFVGIDQILE